VHTLVRLVVRTAPGVSARFGRSTTGIPGTCTWALLGRRTVRLALVLVLWLPGSRLATRWLDFVAEAARRCSWEADGDALSLHPVSAKANATMRAASPIALTFLRLLNPVCLSLPLPRVEGVDG
jgi:hypothetical protein